MELALSLLFCSSLIVSIAGFMPPSTNSVDRIRLYETVETATSHEPKEIVKLFGRLAEKYIMLDDSGGMCCYSACSGEILDLSECIDLGLSMIFFR